MPGTSHCLAGRRGSILQYHPVPVCLVPDLLRNQRTVLDRRQVSPDREPFTGAGPQVAQWLDHRLDHNKHHLDVSSVLVLFPVQ